MRHCAHRARTRTPYLYLYSSRLLSTVLFPNRHVSSGACQRGHPALTAVPGARLDHQRWRETVLLRWSTSSVAQPAGRYFATLASLAHHLRCTRLPSGFEGPPDVAGLPSPSVPADEGVPVIRAGPFAIVACEMPMAALRPPKMGSESIASKGRQRTRALNTDHCLVLVHACLSLLSSRLHQAWVLCARRCLSAAQSKGQARHSATYGRPVSWLQRRRHRLVDT